MGKEKGERRKEKGDCEADERKRINSHAEKGDYVADERKRINKMVSVERLFARWDAFRTATLKPHNLKTL